MESTYFFDRLYPFQDAVLREMAALDTGFYLTGGTAASRGYLGHRFSDDLDFFVNDAPLFSLWSDRVTRNWPGTLNGPPACCLLPPPGRRSAR